MAFLPPVGFPLAGLVVILVGIAIILRKDIPKAYGLGLLVLLLWALETISTLTGGPTFGQALGFQTDRFLAGEQWWSPLTYIFVHAGLLHIASNLLFLLTAGPALEDRVGGYRFLLIFFVASFAAAVVHGALGYYTDIVGLRSVAIGASGGVFGIVTAFAVKYPKEKLPFPLLIIIWLPAFFVLLLLLLINLALAMQFAAAPGRVAWWGHFAGFLVGLAWAYRLPDAPDVVPTGSKGLPDPEKLVPLADTPDLKRILDNIRQFTPEARTRDDTVYADAWLDQFFEKALCPTCGKKFTRRGMTARCQSGETVVDFSR